MRFSKKLYSLIMLVTLAVITLFGLSTNTANAAPLVQINFQDADLTDTPAGYLADTGAAYAARNGFTYGWFREDSLNGAHVPIDGTTEGRDRNNYFADQRFDTLMHMQRTPNGDTLPNIAWEIAVPNGTYLVQIASADQPNNGIYDSTHVVNVEGVTAYTFNATAVNETVVGNVTVTVTDGNLTVDAVGGTNTKINYIIITPDTDNDGIEDDLDNCANIANPGQANNYPAPANSDAEGDACDDTDVDTVLDDVDACPTTFGTLPDGCNPPTPTDGDGDGFPDVSDLCPAVAGGAPDGCPAPVGNGGPYNAPDDRINWGAPGYNDVAIYLVLDDPTNPAIHTYCIDGNSNGFFGLAVSQSDLAQFPAQPASNTLVATSSTCNLSFYILTTGQYQLNIVLDGEIVEAIFDGLPPENVIYRSFIDYSNGAGTGVPASPVTTSNGAVTALSNCRVTPLDILNFRDTADANSSVVTMIPYDYTVEAIGRTADRFNVIFGDDNGWITADALFVETDGNCGD